MHRNQVRCAGHDNFDILWVSRTNSKEIPTNAVVIPNEFDGISDTELIRSYTIRNGVVSAKNAKPESVVVISDYGINCGIATYTKYLCDSLRPIVTNLTILAETAEGLGDEPGVIRCWNRRSPDFSALYTAVEKINPSLIIIQHEFGLFPKLNHWNALMSQLGRWRTVVTFHTVLEHEVIDEVARLDYRTRSLAEGACQEIIVHTPRARQTLRSRGFSGRIHYIPHGCFPPERIPKLPATKYEMFPEHALFQYGFGGSHKGWEFAIDTVECLVKKYPNIMYVGVFNVSKHSGDSKVYYRSLLDRIRKKGLECNAAIHYGYQTEEMLKNFLRSSRAALFLYQVPNPHWASWGASGAIQLPISLGLPLILSTYPAFQEFKGRFPLVTTPQQAANEIDRLFSDPAYEKQLSDNAFAIAEERRWDKVAQWYLNVRPECDFNAPVEVRL